MGRARLWRTTGRCAGVGVCAQPSRTNTGGGVDAQVYINEAWSQPLREGLSKVKGCDVTHGSLLEATSYSCALPYLWWVWWAWWARRQMVPHVAA